MRRFNRLMGSSSKKSRVAGFESLESRRLLAATLVQEAPDVERAGGKTYVVDVSTFLDDPAVNSQVRLTTPSGNVDLELFDQLKPITVANFLNYVRQGRYDGTIIHRATEPSTGLEVLQGGGYKPEAIQDRIPTDPPIVNEAPNDPVLSNLRGTISMARTSDPNSATSEFFLNSVDNTNLDFEAQPPGYAVFGQVINNTIGTVDTIQALPTFDFSEVLAGALGELPLRNYTQTNFDNQQLPTVANNYVTVNAATLPKLTLAVTSSNPAIATAAIIDNKLTVQFARTTGTADITITGTDAQGQAVSTTFTATATPPVDAIVTLGTGANKSVSFTDADGTVATVSLKGQGTAAVTVAGTNVGSTEASGKATVTGDGLTIGSIAVTGGSASTGVTITAKGGDGVVTLAGLTADSALKSIAAKVANLTGTLNVTGALGKLDLGNPTGANINIGGQPTDKPVSMTFAAVNTTDITSAIAVKSITANSFAAADAQSERNSINAPFIGSITSKGAMQQNVTVENALVKLTVGADMSASINANVIGTLTVKGGVSNSSIFAIRQFNAFETVINKITIGGQLNNAVIRTLGNINTITLGSANAATVYAGIASSVNFVTLPDDASDFATQATIRTMTVKTTSADFNVAGFTLNKVSLGTLTTANNATPFGLASSRIGTVSTTIADAKLSLRNLDVPADVDAQSQGVAFADFRVVLV